MISDKFLIFFFILLIYSIIILFLKKIGFGKKLRCKKCNNCCPDCSSALHRIQRKLNDHVIHHITFRTFNCRRYICSNCGWEGLRWEEKFKFKH